MISRPSITRRNRPIADVSDATLHVNPYPAYRELRQKTPVAYAPALRHNASSPNSYWLVTRWDDVVTVLKDDAIYASPTEPAGMPPTFAKGLLYLDGAEHARIRSAMQPACQPRLAGSLADSVVGEIVDGLIDGMEGAGEAELVELFFEPLAVAAMAKLMGLEDVSADDLHRWIDHLGPYFTGEALPSGGEITHREMDDALRANLERLAGEPDSSLLSSMLSAHHEAGPLTEQETLANAKVFAAAGMHELSDVLAHTLLGLLSRPEQLAELRDDPGLARSAIEEGARWASPVGMVPRKTTIASELAGVRIPSGALISAVIASANRDERRFTNGATFDLHRDEGMHLGFASGIHFCLGAWFVRAVGAVVLGRLVERLPGLRLQPGAKLIVNGWRFREVHHLPAAWS